MKVSELIARLQALPPDAEIVVGWESQGWYYLSKATNVTQVRCVESEVGEHELELADDEAIGASRTFYMLE